MRTFCDVCGSIPDGNHVYDRCVIKMMDEERTFNERRLAVWRDDRGIKGRFSRYGRLSDAEEFSTINTITTCAEDVTTVENQSAYDPYVLVIAHIDIFRGNRSGKGFMPRVYRTRPSVYYSSNWKANFDIQQTWQEALEKGTIALQQMVERENQEYAEFEQQQADIKAKKAGHDVR